MSHPVTERLSEYVDATLEPAEQASVAAHVEQCEACAETVAALRAVVARASTLGSIEPPADLWQGIAARIGDAAAPAQATGGARAGEPALRSESSPAAAPAPIAIDRHPGWWSSAFRFTLPQLAAAGLLIAVLSGGVAWLAFHGGLGRQAPAPIAANDGSRMQAGEDLSATNQVAADESAGLPGSTAEGYEATIADLEKTLDLGKDRLDPTTTEVLQRNLAIIDAAITDSRRALAADPESPYLYRHLSNQMQKKVDLLQQATVYAFASH